MNFDILIPETDGSYYCFNLRFGDSGYKGIDVENICVIDLFKYHNHWYSLKAFFYGTKRIYSYDRIGTKRELYDVVQKILKENL